MPKPATAPFAAVDLKTAEAKAHVMSERGAELPPDAGVSPAQRSFDASDSTVRLSLASDEPTSDPTPPDIVTRSPGAAADDETPTPGRSGRLRSGLVAAALLLTAVAAFYLGARRTDTVAGSGPAVADAGSTEPRQPPAERRDTTDASVPADGSSMPDGESRPASDPDSRGGSNDPVPVRASGSAIGATTKADSKPTAASGPATEATPGPGTEPTAAGGPAREAAPPPSREAPLGSATDTVRSPPAPTRPEKPAEDLSAEKTVDRSTTTTKDPSRGSTPADDAGGFRRAVKVYAPPVSYPEAARLAALEGRVVIEARIDDTGSVVETRVLRGVSPELDEAARNEVKQWRFEPATLAGKPVEDTYRTSIRYTLAPGDRPVPLQVGGDVKAPERLVAPMPVYPAAAREAGIAGSVTLTVTIDDLGNVHSVVVREGLPHGLSEAAIEAVSQWKYKPATLDGKPVPVSLLVEIQFH